MDKNPGTNRKIRLFKGIIAFGVCVAIAGAVLWAINFYGMYGVVSQSNSFDVTSSNVKLGETKLNRQAYYRDIGQGFILVGIGIIVGGVLMQSRTKKD